MQKVYYTIIIIWYECLVLRSSVLSELVEHYTTNSHDFYHKLSLKVNCAMYNSSNLTPHDN